MQSLVRTDAASFAPAVPQNQGVTCEKCQTVNRPNIRFCENCGQPLILDVAAQPVKVAAPQGGSCANCRTVNRPGVRFCENCGFDLYQSVSPSVGQAVTLGVSLERQPARGASGKRLVRAIFGVLAGLAVFAAVAVGVFWVINNSRNHVAGTTGNVPSGSGEQSDSSNAPSGSGEYGPSILLSAGSGSGDLSVSLSGFPADSNIIVGIGEPDATVVTKVGDYQIDSQGQVTLSISPCALVSSGTYELSAVASGASAYSQFDVNCSTSQVSVPPDQSGPSSGQQNPSAGAVDLPDNLPVLPRVQLQPYVSIAPYRGGQGTHHVVFLRNFQPNEAVHLAIYNQQTNAILVQWEDQVDSQGNGQPSLTVGNDFALGTYTIAADGALGSMARGEFILEDECMDDIDCDGITDDIEQWFADNYAPYYIFDEYEPAQRGDVAFVYQVTGRFTPDVCDGQTVMVIVALYQDDWVKVSKLAPTIRWHFGDTEAAYLCFKGYELSQISVIRHGELFSYDAHQQKTLESGFSCPEVSSVAYYDPNAAKKYVCDARISFTGTHPIFYASLGKHAVYMQKTECEEAFYYEGAVNLDENCGGGWKFFAGLPADHNVGERGKPNFLSTDDRSDLAWLFPGELIWENGYAFCGGWDVSDDMRNENQKLPGKGDVPVCAGALGGKWLP